MEIFGDFHKVRFYSNIGKYDWRYTFGVCKHLTHVHVIALFCVVHDLEEQRSVI